jgi:hypothetical protein
MEAHHIIEVSIGVIGFLLIAIGGDFYKRLWALKSRVDELEDQMISLNADSALHVQNVGFVKEKVESTAKDIGEIKKELVPSLNRLNTQVALIAQKIQLHLDKENV